MESRLSVGEEVEAYVMGKGSALEKQRQDFPYSQGNFSRLVAFSKVLGLL